MTKLTAPKQKTSKKSKDQSAIDDKAATHIEEQGPGEALDSLVISPYPYPCYF